jgi:hypothetical protein
MIKKPAFNILITRNIYNKLIIASTERGIVKAMLFFRNTEAHKARDSIINIKKIKLILTPKIMVNIFS